MLLHLILSVIHLTYLQVTLLDVIERNTAVYGISKMNTINTEFFVKNKMIEKFVLSVLLVLLSIDSGLCGLCFKI